MRGCDITAARALASVGLLFSVVAAHCPAGKPSTSYDVVNEGNPTVFDGLTTREISDVKRHFLDRDLHSDTPTVNSSYIFTVDREQPYKQDALHHLDHGGPKPDRYARVILYRGDLEPPKIQEYRVGPLAGGGLSHALINTPRWKSDIPYTYRSLVSALDLPAMEAFLDRQLAKVNHILAEVTGYSYGGNCSVSCLANEIMLPGQFESGQQKPWYHLLRKVEGFYIHPVGFQFRVDARARDSSAWSIDYVWFRGHEFPGLQRLTETYRAVADALKADPPLRYDPDDVNLYSSLNHRGDFEPCPASERRGPVTYMPDGRRYMLDGHHVTWQGWQFDFSMQTVKGLRLNDVRFQGERVVYELSLSELAVMYSGASPGAAHTAYLDSHFLLGVSTLALTPGVDCPEFADYFDFAHFIHFKPFVFRKSACLFEWTNSIPLRRHTENNFQGGYHFRHAMADHVLILRSVVTSYNYDYIVDFQFHQNGVLEVVTSLSGYIVSSYYTGRRDDRFGFQVVPQGLANIHNHLIHFKVDLDVAGTANRFETIDVSMMETPDSTEQGRPLNLHVIDRSLKQTEQQAAYLFHFDTPKYLVIHNANQTNAYNNPRGYRILPNGISKMLLPRDWKVERAFSWARYQVAVTRQRDEEDSSSSVHNGANMLDPILNFQSYIDDNENIVDEDLVAWVTLGAFHIPHSEDIPIVQTPGVQLSFLLQPYNMFNEDPSLASRDNVRVTPNQDGGGGDHVQYAGAEPESPCSSNSASRSHATSLSVPFALLVASLATSRR